MRTAALLLLGVFPALAGEVAVLANGFSIRVDRHESVGGKMVLYKAGGEIELPAGQVVRFEQEDVVESQAESQARMPVPQPLFEKPSARELVDRAAEKYGLPPALLSSVVKAESGFRAEAVSVKGAVGLMQLMPGTAAELNADPSDPEQNVEAGARYLRDLLVKYGYSSHRALAAYNAGPGAVDKYNGVPPYRETQQYVDRVVGEFLKTQMR